MIAALFYGLWKILLDVGTCLYQLKLMDIMLEMHPMASPPEVRHIVFIRPRLKESFYYFSVSSTNDPFSFCHLYKWTCPTFDLVTILIFYYYHSLIIDNTLE